MKVYKQLYFTFPGEIYSLFNIGNIIKYADNVGIEHFI